jgi:hypothetical protein
MEDDYVVNWNENGITIQPLYTSQQRSSGNGPSATVPALVARAIDMLGGGLQVEFDQSLLSAAPGCAPGTSQREETLGRFASEISGNVIKLAEQLGITLPPPPVSEEQRIGVIASLLDAIGEQVAGAQRDELAAADKLPHGAGPGEHIDTDAPPQAKIGDVAVGEAPAEQPRRKRRTKAEIEADNAAAEAAKKKPADKPAAAQPTKPDPVATAAFQGDMASIDAKQKAEAPPAAVQVKPADAAPAQETRVELVGDELDEMVELLSNPPLPVDLHPLDLKRNPSDKQFLDTAVVRLNFGYCLGEEYKKDPNFQPGNPPNSPVNMKTDEGVVALVQWLMKIAERAAQKGKPIGQLDTVLMLGTPEEVIGDMVKKVRERRERAAAQRAAAQAAGK